MFLNSLERCNVKKNSINKMTFLLFSYSSTSVYTWKKSKYRLLPQAPWKTKGGIPQNFRSSSIIYLIITFL